MKTKELKIGDNVSYKGKAAKIHSLDSPCIYIDVDDGILGTLEDDANLAPILLTEEILEKNGWEKDMDGTQCYYFDKYCIRKAHPKEERWMLFLTGAFVTSFKHTHQLQHLLWALGIDDNLKI